MTYTMGFYYFNPNDGKVYNINGNKDKFGCVVQKLRTRD